MAAYQRLLAALGVSQGEASRLTAALVDWIDLDRVPVSADGAEDDWYGRQTPVRLPPNAALTDVDELTQVRGYGVELVNRLRPFVAALPSAAPLNVNTAEPEVLVAMLPGLRIDAARVLVAQRR